MKAVAPGSRLPATAMLVAALDTLRRVLDAVGTSAPDRLAVRAAEALATYSGFDAVAVRIVPASAGERPSQGRAGRATFPEGILEVVAWPALDSPGATCAEPDLRARGEAWRGSLAGAAAAADGKGAAAVAVWSRRPHVLMPWHQNLLEMAASMLAMALRAGPPAESPAAPAAALANGLDPLTGLPDRAGFVRQLTLLAGRPRPVPRGRYLLFVDVDRFHLVHQYGYRIGAARLLRTLGRILQRHAASELLLGRIGPDQFGIVIERGSPQGALAFANELVDHVDALRLSLAGQRFEVSISIGVVEVGDQPSSRPMRLAEQACLAAKRQGGGMVEFYDRDLRAGRRWTREGRLLNRMVAALKDDRLELFAQVVVPVTADAGVARPMMYELLLRMRSDDGKLLEAGMLLEVAERHGLSVRLDRWVIRSAFASIARSRFARREGCRFMLNLSGHSLDDACLLRFIVDEFTATGLSPSRICFEITETAAISDIRGAQRFVDGLRGLGCEFALDDFGSGHSSFLYLRDLAVDYVKIDGELVSAIADDPVSLSLVRTIEGVGRLMGRKTIAEHVERPDILDAVREIGCGYAQGYWIGSPLPLARVLAGDEDPDGID